MLRFHAESVSRFVYPTALACNCSAKMISSVKLHSRFGGQHFQHPPGSWLINARHQTEFTRRFIDDKILVVAAAELELFIVLIDASSDGRGFSEIEGRALYRFKFACGDQIFVRWRKLLGVDHDFVIQYVAFAGQVEVRMLS